MSAIPAFPDIGRLPVVDGKPLFWQELPLYSGLIPVITEPLAARPVLHFKGGKINKPMWEQIISFLLWTQEKFKAEAQVRLFYHMDRKEWRVVVAPQEAVGLSVKELADHPDKAVAYAAAENEGFFCMGTVHHHCTIGAFMSGTDREDEQKQNGLHITVGKLDQPVLDLHARASLRGVLFGVCWNEWFDFPESELAVPVTGKHPAEWEGRMIPPRPVVHQWDRKDWVITHPQYINHWPGQAATHGTTHHQLRSSKQGGGYDTCPECWGFGFDGERDCQACNGSGWVTFPKESKETAEQNSTESKAPSELAAWLESALPPLWYPESETEIADTLNELLVEIPSLLTVLAALDQAADKLDCSVEEVAERAIALMERIPNSVINGYVSKKIDNLPLKPDVFSAAQELEAKLNDELRITK